MSLALLFHYLMLNMFRMLIHHQELATYLLSYFIGCIALVEPEQNNPWNNSTHKSQAPEDGCINIRNMLSIK